MKKQVKQIGIDVIAGIISGIDSKLKSLKNKISSVSSTVTNGLKSAFKIQSPSKVMMGIGENISKGLEIGIDFKGFEQKFKSLKNEVNTLTPSFVASPVSNRTEIYNLSDVIVRLEDIKDVATLINTFRNLSNEKTLRRF
jgi:phage-related protein